jgi:hypothetical protein
MSSREIVELNERILEFFIQRAKAEDIAICPQMSAIQTLLITRMVYSEIYNYQCLQIVMLDPDDTSIELGNFDFHFDIIGRHKENSLLNISLIKVPTEIQPLWDVRRLWMQSEASESLVQPLLYKLQNAKQF